jgi:hypothetical protein
MTDTSDIALATTSVPQHIDKARITLEPRRQNPEDWPRRLRRREASAYLREVHGLHEASTTLAKKACLGGGPIFEYFGRVPYYRTENLDRYAESRLSGPRRSTSDIGEAAPTERHQVTWPHEQPASLRRRELPR